MAGWLRALLPLFLLGCGVLGHPHPGKGNSQLKKALDSAAVAAYLEGVWDRTVGLERDVSLPFYCDWDESAELFPPVSKLAAHGALADVLEMEEIIFGYVNTTLRFVGHDGSTYVALDTTNSPPTGPLKEWHDALVAHLGRFYNKEIASKYVIQKGATQVIQALQTNEVHVAITPFNFGGVFLGKQGVFLEGNRRSEVLLLGCPDSALSHGRLYRLEDDRRFLSYDEFRIHESSQPAGTYSIAAKADQHCNYYKTLYLRSNVECLSNSSFVKDGLKSGTYDLTSFDLDDDDDVELEPLSGTLPASSFYGSLYRKDECVDEIVIASGAAAVGVCGLVLGVAGLVQLFGF